MFSLPSKNNSQFLLQSSSAVEYTSPLYYNRTFVISYQILFGGVVEYNDTPSIGYYPHYPLIRVYFPMKCSFQQFHPMSEMVRMKYIVYYSDSSLRQLFALILIFLDSPKDILIRRRIASRM